MFAEINADQRDFTHGSLPPRSNASSLGDASGDRADHFIMSGFGKVEIYGQPDLCKVEVDDLWLA
ncbi:protein of unknown function (plasmid) [Cupriavidus taiwanensis]|nr:protein of unknown function [Cupriavidus taiwanensis]